MYCRFNHVWLFVAPWTVACQDPLTMEFSRQEYWSDPGIEPNLLHLPALADRFGPLLPNQWSHLPGAEGGDTAGAGQRPPCFALRVLWYSLSHKAAAQGTGLSGFKSLLCHLPAAWPGASFFLSYILTCRMEIWIVFTSQNYDAGEIKHVKSV